MSVAGISLWRQISETLVAEIKRGVWKSGEQLPADTAIAARFGVNRHTVRRAVGHLETEGIVRVERGRGTFVVEDVLQYRLGVTTRFTANLLQNHRAPTRTVLALSEVAAQAAASDALELELGESCILLTVLGAANSVPLSLGHNYFPSRRLPGLLHILREQSTAASGEFSITQALRAAGVENYRRQRTQISARLPNEEEIGPLRMPRTQPIIETESVDVIEDGTPITYAKTCFRADRLQFVVGD
jgi:GntR family transcriptional regulator, phosphonate transport system regulatory protein